MSQLDDHLHKRLNYLRNLNINGRLSTDEARELLELAKVLKEKPYY